MKKRVLRWGVCLFAAALVCFLLGLFPQAFLKKRVEGALGKRLGGTLTLESLSFVPGTLTAEAKGVDLVTPVLQFRAARLRVSASWTSLAGEGLVIRTIEIDSPDAHLYSQGPSSSGGAAGSPPRIVVEKIAVTGGRVSGDEPPFSLEGIEAHGGLGTGSVDLVVGGGSWGRPQALTLRPTRARLRLSPTLDMNVESFEGGTTRSSVSVKGSLGSWISPTPRLELEGQLDLEDALALGLPAPTSGILSATGRVDGSRLEAHADGALLVLGGVSLQGTHLEVKGEGRVLSGSFTTRAIGGGLSGHGTWAHGSLDASVRASDLTLSPPVGGRISGEVAFKGDPANHLEVHGGWEAQAIPVKGTNVSATGHVSGGLTQGTPDLAWDAELHGEGPAYRVSPSVLRARGTAKGPMPPELEGTFDGTLALGAPEGAQECELQGSFRQGPRGTSGNLDAQGFGGGLHAELGAEGALTLNAQGFDLARLAPGAGGRADFSMQGSLSSAQGSVELQSVSWREISIGGAHLDFKGSPKAGSFSGAAPAQKATLQGTWNPRGVLEGRLTLEGTVLPPLSGTSGSATGTIDFALPTSDLASSQLHLELRDLALSHGDFHVRNKTPLILTTHGKDLTIEALSLQAEGISLEASGRASPSALNVGLIAQVDARNIPASEVNLVGTLHVETQITGPPTAPLAEGFVEADGLEISAPGRPTLAVPKARVDLHGGIAEAKDVHLGLGGGEVIIKGTMPWTGALPKSLQPATTEPEGHLVLTWSGIQASELGAGSLEGAFAGELVLDGSPSRIGQARGVLTMPETSLKYDDLAVEVQPVRAVLLDGVATIEGMALKTPGGAFEVRGNANLATGQLSSSLTGVLDLRLLSSILESASVGGAAKIDLTVKGSFRDPRPSGRVEIANGTLRSRSFPQPVTSIQGTLVFEGDGARLEAFSGELGGGRLDLSGSARVAQAKLSGVDLRLKGAELGLRFPEGLRSRVDADLAFTGDPGRFLLKGDLTADRGLYDLDLVLTQGLTSRAAAVEESPLLRSFGLDLSVRTKNPIRVRNNVARLETEGSLGIRGDIQDPAPFGRLDLGEGGTIYLQAQEFKITTGSLTFGGTFDPTIHVETTRAIRDTNSALGKTNQEYLVTVSLNGSLSSPRLTLKADPSELSEDQVLALIATGETAGSTSASRLAGAQAASLLAGNIGRSLSQGLSRFGLGDISVRPELLARETDPGARFTFGKDLARNITLIYSLDLNDTQGRFVQLQARPGKGVTLLAQRADDGTATLGAGQNLRFGGYHPPKTKPREEEVQLTEVRFEGDTPLDQATLAKVAKAKVGDKTTLWRLQDDADHLREFLVKRGFIEAEVGARQEGSAGIFKIHAGSHFTFRVLGMTNPPDLTSVVQKALFEDEALDHGRAKVLEVLRGRGELKAASSAEAKDEGSDRVLIFSATPGPVVPLKDVVFVGARALSQKTLLAAAGGPASLLTTPLDAVRSVTKAYVAKGYLGAKVHPPHVSDEPGGVVINVEVEEGPLAQVAAVRFPGATLPTERLLSLSAIRPGTPALEADLPGATARIRGEYLVKGYTQARVVPSLAAAGHDLDVVFTIEEGPAFLVGPIEIKGLTKTRRGLVERQISIHPGDALDLRKLATIERRLLDLGVFDRVVVTASDSNPATITVDLKEGPWGVAGYDLRWDDVEHGTALVDSELRNLFGTGVALGGRYRIGSDVEEIRGSLHASSLGVFGDATLSVFHIRQNFAAVDFFTQEPITNVQIQNGVRLFTTRRIGKSWTLQTGYDHSRVESTLEPTPVGVGGLNVSVFGETRDNILDAQKGHFLSLSLDYDPSWLGSDFNFKKSLAQAFVIHGLSPSWIWAQGLRLGLAKGFGGFTTPVGSPGQLESTSSGNFLAGGADTLRGYATNEVGPVNFLGQFVGGDAVVIVNEELRYRHPSGLGAAFFYDGGNVFDTVSHLNFAWKHDLGLGLRYVSPVGLLRLDFAFPLNRMPGDKPVRIFFNIGQIF